jgi:hypothetical protein
MLLTGKHRLSYDIHRLINVQGVDPKVCAAQNGVSISSGFSTATGTSKGNSAPTSSSSSNSGSLVLKDASEKAGSIIGLVGLMAGAMALL